MRIALSGLVVACVLAFSLWWRHRPINSTRDSGDEPVATRAPPRSARAQQRVRDGQAPPPAEQSVPGQTDLAPIPDTATVVQHAERGSDFRPDLLSYQILGAADTPPPRSFVGSDLRWRFESGITDDQRIALLGAYSGLTLAERSEVLRSVEMVKSVELIEPLTRVAEHVQPVASETSLYVAVVATLVRRHRDRKGPGPRASGRHSPAEADDLAGLRRKAVRSALAVAMPVLDQEHRLIPDRTWGLVRTVVELAASPEVVGDAPVALPRGLSLVVNRTLENFVGEHTAFAAGSELFWLATHIADHRTVDLMITASRVFEDRRARLPESPRVARSCLAAAATVVADHGDTEQRTRYLELVIGGGIAASDDAARRELVPIWMRLAQRDDVTPSVRERARQFVSSLRAKWENAK